MRRRRDRFPRLGLLAIALLLGLCVTGIGYAAWTDQVTIQGSVETATIEVALSPGACSNPGTISCSVDSEAPHTLVVTLTNPPAGNYTCDFTIVNTGTIPVRIQSIIQSGNHNGTASVTGVARGTQIEQAGGSPDSVQGTVTVEVQTSCEGTFELEVAFTFVQWNLYVEE